MFVRRQSGRASDRMSGSQCTTVQYYMVSETALRVPVLADHGSYWPPSRCCSRLRFTTLPGGFFPGQGIDRADARTSKRSHSAGLEMILPTS